MIPQRQAAFPIDRQFLDRRSPRAFDGSAIGEQTLMTLFEAARWAPSAFNAQPWRFAYAHRGSDDWPVFVELLVPFNRTWAANAAVLIVILSDTLMRSRPDAELKPSHSHSFDAGAAWAMLALQAGKMGLATHAMTGVDFAAARAELAVPDRFRIECAVAVGRTVDPVTLDAAARMHESSSERRLVNDMAFAGRFPPAA